MYYLWGEEDENKEEYGRKCLVEYSACGEPSHFAMPTIKEMTRSTHSLKIPLAFAYVTTVHFIVYDVIKSSVLSFLPFYESATTTGACFH
jgi:hypothetical protein